jgi:hypothetical protein
MRIGRFARRRGRRCGVSACGIRHRYARPKLRCGGVVDAVSGGRGRCGRWRFGGRLGRGRACWARSPCGGVGLSSSPVSPDKGTGVRYEISGASAPFCPSPPLPPSPASGRGGNLSLGEPPFASTPLSHAVGEGLGVRAKKRAHLAHSELKRCTLTPLAPLSRKRARRKPVVGRTAVRLHTPLPPCGRGAGGEGEKACAPRTQRTQTMYPHPPCPPLPQAGEGETCRWANRRSPLHPSPTLWERGWG